MTVKSLVYGTSVVRNRTLIAVYILFSIMAGIAIVGWGVVFALLAGVI